jgi:isoquinoline 1-oxidoreductase beta subunit
MAGWGRRLPERHGLGVALVESFGTIFAEVAEVDMAAAIPLISRVWVATDPGSAVSPDGFAAQIESGVIYGLSAALHGNITLQSGAVAQSNFDNYTVIRMDDAPAISVRILNSGAWIGGGGEPGTPPIAPAVANAIFAVTSKRFRTLPLV